MLWLHQDSKDRSHPAENEMMEGKITVLQKRWTYSYCKMSYRSATEQTLGAYHRY